MTRDQVMTQLARRDVSRAFAGFRRFADPDWHRAHSEAVERELHRAMDPRARGNKLPPGKYYMEDRTEDDIAEAYRDILQFLSGGEWRTHMDAKDHGVNPYRVRNAVRYLVAAGFVEKLEFNTRRGVMRYRITRSGEDALLEMKEGDEWHTQT